MSTNVNCDYCGKPAALVTGADLHPHLPHLAGRYFWRCAGCDAHVGCHPRSKKHKRNGWEPLGRLANPALRRLKIAAHAALDPLWKSPEAARKMSRSDAYAWLAEAMQLTPEQTHIGMFDETQCQRVVELVRIKQTEETE